MAKSPLTPTLSPPKAGGEEEICYRVMAPPGMTPLSGCRRLVKGIYFSASTGGLGALDAAPRGNLTWLLMFNRMPTASKLTSSPEPP